MATKRTYKALTTKQSAKVKKYTKAGKSQKAIAKLLGVSKLRVSTAQKKAGAGKRRPSPFWGEVSQAQKEWGWDRAKATREVMTKPKWRQKYFKRTGRKRITTDEIGQALKRKIREAFKAITGKEYEQRKGTAGEDTVTVEYDGVEYTYLGEK